MPLVIGIPAAKTQIVRHDMAVKPFVQEATKVVNPLIGPFIATSEKLRDVRTEFLIQFQMLFEGRISALFHERLFVGEVRNHIIQQFGIRLVDGDQPSLRATHRKYITE